ncbi:signal peptidase II [Corynebacterium sp. MSK008]|uniref:signal peptidase II n=1 Tax=Corynebacterium sp. MSK008 TaxID=3050188 RepID=UPI00254FB1B6|nr:signal peptidase II [Corynebacterium sp. MSK008]MDK8878389.1 signal peptidase II [Corynebacterium sp. MSK008]
MKQDTTAQRTPRYLGLVVAVMLAVGAADQGIKQLMLNWLEPGVPQPVIGDWFRFYLLFNSGAAFSMGENLTWLFTAIQLAFVLGALWFGPRMTSKWEALGLALVAGGALGNLIDRLFRDPGFWFGHVVDYISVGNFAVFNLADAAITVGVVVFILGTIAVEMKGGDNGR